MSKRQNYTVDELKAATSEAKRSKVSIRKIARDFGVPRKTITDHLNGTSTRFDSGPDRMLLKAEEDALVGYLKYIARQGFPMTRAMVRAYVISIVKKSGRTTLFNMDTGPSDNWFRKFFGRHNELTERQSEPQDRGRARMSNDTVMDQYFALLQQQVTELKIESKPGQIFNCDETGWSGKERSKLKVIGEKGCHTYQQAVTSAGHITAHLCISADGRIMPTFVIFEKCLPHISYKDGVPGNWMYGYSESGYMDTQLFHAWFRDLFIPSCGKERPVLLVMDNHDSHLSLDVVELAIENKITLLGLPPHTTHILQPLDVSINGPLKAKFQSLAVSLGFINKQQVLNKAKFPAVLSFAIDQHMSPARVKESFRKAGLYPINKDAIDRSQITPSHIAIESHKQTNVAQPSTLTEPSSSVQPSTYTQPTTSAVVPAPTSTCPTCGTFLGGNPLVKEGIIPEELADLFPAVPCKPHTASRRKLITEARVITTEAFHQQLEDKKNEAIARKEEVEKRKEEREKRKLAKEESKGKKKQRIPSMLTNKKKTATQKLTVPVPPIISQDVCQLCHSVDPPNSLEEDIEWIDCDICEEWYHQTCLGLDFDADDEPLYICDGCAKKA